MKPRVAILVAAASLLLAACEPVSGPVPAPGTDACGATALTYLVGQPESAATGISHDGVQRIIRPGMMVTMDYSPNRLNIEIGEDGRIARVFCG